MKINTKRFGALSLALCLCLVIFGCWALSASGSPGSGEIEENLVTGFDTQDFIYHVTGHKGFGKRLLNTDPNYIRQGAGSLYLELQEQNTSPQWVGAYALSLPMNLLDHSDDFSKTVKLVLDVYNASDRDTEMRLVLTGGIGGSTYMVDLGYQYITKGRWNRVTYLTDLDRAINLGIDSVRAVKLYFPVLSEGQSPLKLYLDNFRAIDDPAVTYQNQNRPAMQGGAVCTFENPFYFNKLTVDNRMSGQYMPEFSLNYDKEYVSEGDVSLKIKRFSQYSPHERWSNFCITFLPIEPELSAINFTQYPLNSAKLVYDVYSKYDGPLDCITYLSSSGYGGYFVDHPVTLQPNQWNRIEIPLNKTMPNGAAPTAQIWNGLNSFRIQLIDFYGASNAIMYLDNFRLEN